MGRFVRESQRRGIRAAPALRALLCVALLAFAAPGRLAHADDRPASPLAQKVRQAKHYLRRGHLSEARETITEALGTPEGRADPSVQLEAARVYRDLGDVALALHALDEVLESGNEDQRGKAETLRDQLAKAYGELHIAPSGDERQLRGRVLLESGRPLISARQKAVFAHTQASLLGEARRYPTSVWLPLGPLKVNGVAVEHTAGSLTRVRVPFPQVAIIRSEVRAADQAPLDAILAGVGGRPKVYDMEGSLDKGMHIIHALRAAPPALLISLGAKATVLARRELGDLPLVFGMLEHDWRCYGLQGEGALLGVATHPPPPVLAKELKRLLPAARAVGLLHNPKLCRVRVDDLREALAGEKLALVEMPLAPDGSLGATLERGAPRVDALWMLPDPPLTRLQVFRRLLSEAIDRRLPLVVPSGELVRSGALIALEGERAEVGRQMAELARGLLFAGADPVDPEVSAPARQVLHLNLTNAERIGVQPSPELQRSVQQIHRGLPALAQP